MFTPEEVAAHDRPNDCWLIVRGSVYDVSPLVPEHPGGDMILLKAGGDVTSLFDAYHQQHVCRFLERFLIGRMQGGEERQHDDFFYVTLKRRVLNHLGGPGRGTFGFHVKAWLVIAMAAALYRACFFIVWPPVVAGVMAAVFGLSLAQVLFNVAHDAGHYAASSSNAVCRAYVLCADVIGWSSFMWAQQHVVGHHTHTNVEGMDPDIRMTPIINVTTTQPRMWHHRLQHVYTLPLYGLAHTLNTVMDVWALLSGRLGTVRVPPMSGPDRAIFWGGKAAFATWAILLPATFSLLPMAHVAALLGVAMLFAGWSLGLVFQIAHVNPDSRVVTAPNESWARGQIMATADFCPGSWFWTHFTGGLNYQTVHHLLPGVCHMHYPALAPIVRRTCAEFGVPYVVYPTIWAALSAHFKHLYAMGQV